MTDKIQSVDEANEPRDREDLNVGGRVKNKKVLIIVVFLIVAFGVGFTGLYFAFKNAGGEPVVEREADNNFIAGSVKSSLDDSDNYFDTLRKEKIRKEEAAKSKNITEEENRLKLEMEKEKIKTKTKKVVTRTGQTASKVQPKPKRDTSKQSNRKNKKQGMTAEERKMQGSILVSVRGSQAEPKAPKNFSQAFNASTFEDGKAGLRPDGSMDFLLVHGTSLPCALYTQIISDYEGFVTCRITQDVYSANGAALLIEKGSLVSGTQSVALEAGKSRVFTSWADVETPLGASIRIDSLGTGPLGASGIEAWVDNHYQERFGGAILLSFVDDALGALSEKLANNGGVGVDNSTKNGSDMASKALEASINIQPTGYAFIGQRINILVARDIDMSSIYHFEESQ